MNAVITLSLNPQDTTVPFVQRSADLLNTWAKMLTLEAQGGDVVSSGARMLANVHGDTLTHGEAP